MSFKDGVEGKYSWKFDENAKINKEKKLPSKDLEEKVYKIIRKEVNVLLSKTR